MDYLKDFLNAQMEMRNVEKAAKNEFGGYKYSTIDSIINAIKGPLNKNGFVICQQMISEEGKQYLLTEFIHTSGNKLSSKIHLDMGTVDPKKSIAQLMGSLITYYRKYSLTCLAGICSGENDDDGEALTPDRFISPAEVKELIARIGKYEGLLADVLSLNKVIDLKFIAPDKLEPTFNFIEKAIKNKYDVTPTESDNLPLDDVQREELRLLLTLDTTGTILARLKERFNVEDIKDIPQSKFIPVKDWVNKLIENRKK